MGTDAPDHRVHVHPALRRIGSRLLLPNWLAITIGRHVFTWRPLAPAELAHELEHVRQWDRYGVRFAARYLRASLRSWRAGSGWYRGNAFEIAARAAVQRASTGSPGARDEADSRA
jgi:hypothetical protein